MQVLKQNFRAAMCHVLHYSCNVNAAVADSLHCRMICGTVPFSGHAECPQRRQRRDRRRQRIPSLCRGNGEGAIADGPVQ